jgi:rhodanese-related sulfurtransferase
MNNKLIEMKRMFLCISVLLIATSAAIAQSRLKEDITCEKALLLIQKHNPDTGFVILDVRTSAEYNSGHIENAINIDYKSADFQERISKLDKKRAYLVYCKAGVRSANTIGIMKDLDFNNLHHLFEGMKMWIYYGYKTVKD